MLQKWINTGKKKRPLRTALTPKLLKWSGSLEEKLLQMSFTSECWLFIRNGCNLLINKSVSSFNIVFLCHSKLLKVLNMSVFNHFFWKMHKLWVFDSITIVALVACCQFIPWFDHFHASSLFSATSCRQFICLSAGCPTSRLSLTSFKRTLSTKPYEPPARRVCFW